MDGSSAISKRRLHESILIAEAALSREHRKVDALLLLDEANIRLIVVLFSSFEILFGLSLISTEKQDLSANQPKLAGILLRNRLKHVVQDFKGPLVVPLTQTADDRVVGILVNVERAKAHI